MKSSNQVIMERDMFCPFCGRNSAVLIAETVNSKRRIGCAPIGLKDGCLICLTGGCWTLISGLPILDVKEHHWRYMSHLLTAGILRITTENTVMSVRSISAWSDTAIGENSGKWRCLHIGGRENKSFLSPIQINMYRSCTD
ncbi:MAG: hypothetical protein IKQ39_08600 [Oscillospiraceae bacterium]|nr:hypothetical protein [Oscillospiraceae bacterium]